MNQENLYFRPRLNNLCRRHASCLGEKNKSGITKHWTLCTQYLPTGQIETTGTIMSDEFKICHRRGMTCVILVQKPMAMEIKSFNEYVSASIISLNGHVFKLHS